MFICFSHIWFCVDNFIKIHRHRGGCFSTCCRDRIFIWMRCISEYSGEVSLIAFIFAIFIFQKALPKFCAPKVVVFPLILWRLSRKQTLFALRMFILYDMMIWIGTWSRRFQDITYYLIWKSNNIRKPRNTRSSCVLPKFWKCHKSKVNID